MKCATTINELANNLLTNRLPSPTDDKNIYVPVYEDLLLKLRDKLQHTEDLPTQTLFITGQPGTGKSTALNFLMDDELKNKFIPLILNAEELLDLNDIDIIDVILLFGFKLVEQNKALEKTYFEKLDHIQQTVDGHRESEETRIGKQEVSVGANAAVKAKISLYSIFSAEAGLSSAYKRNHEVRQKTRTIFAPKKEEIFALVNSIITDWMSECGEGKELLLILDGLEKIRDKKHIDSIFRDNYRYLVDLNCCKVIAIPVSSASNPEIANICRQIERFILRLKPNPLDPPEDPDKDNKIIERNKQLFTDIVYKRIADDSKGLISQEAIDEAVKMSGGILRQFIDILYTATVRVRRSEGSTVSKNDVEAGWKELKATLDFAVVTGPTIKMLNQVRTEHMPLSDNSAEFVEALQSLQALAYQNGTVWYEVNPLIEKTVEIYANKF